MICPRCDVAMTKDKCACGWMPGKPESDGGLTAQAEEYCTWRTSGKQCGAIVRIGRPITHGEDLCRWHRHVSALGIQASWEQFLLWRDQQGDSKLDNGTLWMIVRGELKARYVPPKEQERRKQQARAMAGTPG